MKNALFNLLLLICIPLKTVKNFTTIDLHSSWVDVLEVVMTFNDLSNNVYVPNKAKDLNLSVFKMITWINELKALTKHIFCECKCRFDGKKSN